MNKHVIKEYLAHFIYKSLASFPVKAEYEDRRITEQLNERGHFLIPDFLPHSECDKLVEEFSKIVANSDIADVWKDELGADTRLFFAERYSDLFRAVLGNDYLQRMKRLYMGPNVFKKNDCLMVNHIVAIKDNLGSGGGWHRDSPYSKQFKAIIYLSEVEAENGPFQYVEKTHRLASCIDLYKKKYTTEGQNRLTEKEVDEILAYLGSEKLQTFTASKGSCILVNTKGIHRGKPITKKERYALTFYFDSAETLAA